LIKAEMDMQHFHSLALSNLAGTALKNYKALMVCKGRQK
jgi:hypothetical protein